MYDGSAFGESQGIEQGLGQGIIGNIKLLRSIGVTEDGVKSKIISAYKIDEARFAVLYERALSQE